MITARATKSVRAQAIIRTLWNTVWLAGVYRSLGARQYQEDMHGAAARRGVSQPGRIIMLPEERVRKI
jgi:hypothetical protein